MRRANVWGFGLAVVASLVLAACGEDDSGSSGGAAGSSSSGSGGETAGGGDSGGIAGGGGDANGGSESGGSESGGSESGGSSGTGGDSGGSAGSGGDATGGGDSRGSAGSGASSGSGGDATGGGDTGGSAGSGATGGGGGANVAECQDWEAQHPDWIFCDDFEAGGDLQRAGRYFEYDDNDGDFVPVSGAGLSGTTGMRVRWQAGEVEAGSLKVAFGRNPNSYMDNDIHSDEDFREIYYRMYLRMQEGWQGSPAKLSRATVFYSSSDWSQAMIAHLWSDDDAHLIIDPASCVSGGSPICSGYNDFDSLSWLGIVAGSTPIFATDRSGIWYCIEAHVRLNDPGAANGVQEFWIDGNLEARSDELDFVGTYQDYAINAVFFENYWNAGSVQEQERYFDNLVISTQPIGCVGP